jgi:hypothetical protein
MSSRFSSSRRAAPRRLAARVIRATGATGALLLAAVLGCAPPTTAAGPPPPSRVGYERLQAAYGTWQLLDRAREATVHLQSWRELDPETGSVWQYAQPNRNHYHILAADGLAHEGYESEETDCWRREDGGWDRRPIGRRPPVAAALAEELFGGAVRIINEGSTTLDGVEVQIVRFNQRAGDRRWYTLARDREVRVWLAFDDALPRRVEVAMPSFQQPETQSVRLLDRFDEPLDVEPPCS